MKRELFDTEHNMFRKSFRTFLEREVLPHRKEWEAAGIVPRDIWLKAGKNGFLVPWVDEQYGGTGVKDFRFDQIICEELGRANEAGFFIPLQNSLVAPYINEFGNEEQKKRILPKCVTGETILAIAMTEPGTGSDLAGMKTKAVDMGDHFILNGSKTFISNGLLADVILVTARTDPENPHAMGMFIVERGQKGFERGRNLEKIGMKSQDTAELFFSNVIVPKANVLGDPSQGFMYLMKMLAQERLTLACGAVGGAQAAYDLTKSYIKERKAFGKPISKFQNTRFKMAEMKTEIDMAQVFVDRCVMDHNKGTLTGDIACQAKLYTSELACRVADECVQLHGGYGYMMEYPIASMYLNVRIHRIFAGTSEIMKEVIARANGL